MFLGESDSIYIYKTYIKIRIFLFFYRDNILRYITLIDFGLSRILGENELIENEPFGTLGYAAPEILMGDRYGFSVDLFSIGVMMYYLLYKALPFDGENDDVIYKNKIEYKVNWLCKGGKVQDFLEMLMNRSNRKRGKIDELLSHQWINNKIV